LTAAEAAKAAAAAKAGRGWKVDIDNELASLLPEPDLVEYHEGAIVGQLLEGAALGCLIWEAEETLRRLGCQLVRRPVPRDSS
jgi:hypothetical protein